MAIKRAPMVVLSVPALVMLLPGPAASGSASLLRYDYEFQGATGIVNNSAPAGPAVPLTLYGAWTAVSDGVHFSGDTSGSESVAYGRPATGYTINTPATSAFGFGARIVYDSPPSGTCFADTPNVTQIGRDSVRAPSAQAKIQLSSCARSHKHVVAECRFAGSLTASHTPPLASTLPLINGHAYNISCRKSPDRADNTTRIRLSVTNLNAAKGPRTVTNTFTVPALGYLRSRSYLSVGNKYPLPPPARNTDQFNGDVTRAVYCTGTLLRVTACLANHLPKS